MITAETIRRIAPRAREDYVSALVNGGDVLEHYGINTPMRLAKFMANVCAETGGLTIVRENGNYSAERIRQVWPTRPEAVKFARNPRGLFNAVYGARMGNQRNGTADDDGWNYRGGGFLQSTGRDNYETIGKAIGIPLGEHPELIEDATVSLKAAAHEFAPLVKYCDKGESGFRAVCNGINRGNPLSSLDPIGWVDRQHWLKKCLDVIGASGPAEDVLEVGDSGAMVKAIQERLVALRYPVGKVDGVFGSRTRAQVLAFQAENGLETDGRIGPQTRMALNSESAKPMPLGERATENKADLKAAGSGTLQATDAIKTTAKAAGAITTITAVSDQTGLLVQGKLVLEEMTKYRGVASGIAEVLTWSLGHWYYFVPFVCYFGWKWANGVEGRRVLKHQLGLDLSL